MGEQVNRCYRYSVVDVAVWRRPRSPPRYVTHWYHKNVIPLAGQSISAELTLAPAHWRQRGPSAASHTLITSGRFRSSSKIESAIDTHRYRHTPTV
jgi:hypothetical protein